jgi:hypothetical protein
MNAVFPLVKENDLNVCPECGNRRGNEIEITSEVPQGEVGSASCAKSGIGWTLDPPEE